MCLAAHSKVPENAGEEQEKETGDKTLTNVPPKEEVETPELKVRNLFNYSHTDLTLSSRAWAGKTQSDKITGG